MSATNAPSKSAKLSAAQELMLRRIAVAGPTEHLRISRGDTRYALQKKGLATFVSTGGLYWFVAITDAGRAALQDAEGKTT